jgi:hypothetical protein
MTEERLESRLAVLEDARERIEDDVAQLKENNAKIMEGLKEVQITLTRVIAYGAAALLVGETVLKLLLK